MKDFFINLIPFLFPLCVIMIFMFIVDTITGVAKAKINKTFSSSKLRACVPKYLLYFCLVAVCICIDFILVYYLNYIEIPELFIKIANHYPITTACKLFVIVIEIVSIFENLKEAGIKIPNWLTNLIEKIHKDVE